MQIFPGARPLPPPRIELNHYLYKNVGKQNVCRCWWLVCLVSSVQTLQQDIIIDIDNLVTRVRFTLLVVEGADIHTFGGVNYLGKYTIAGCLRDTYF